MKVIGKTPQAMTNVTGNLRSRAYYGSRTPRVIIRSPDRQVPKDEADHQVRIAISGVEDIVKARRTAGQMVQQMGFSGSRITLVKTVVSELARNILLYATAGEIVLSRRGSGAQLTVAALDHGPGIENLPRVMAGGYSTSGGQGLGLRGLRCIVDEFEITTQLDKGTQVLVSIRGG